MKYLLLVVSLVFALVANAKEIVINPEVVFHESEYSCVGFDPRTGTDYASKLKIFEKQNSYHFEWTNTKELPQAYGTGFITEVKQDNITTKFFVISFQENQFKANGSQLYQVKGDGDVLSGEWVFLGNDIVGNETCVRLKRGN